MSLFSIFLNMLSSNMFPGHNIYLDVYVDLMLVVVAGPWFHRTYISRRWVSLGRLRLPTQQQRPQDNGLASATIKTRLGLHSSMWLLRHNRPSQNKVGDTAPYNVTLQVPTLQARVKLGGIDVLSYLPWTFSCMDCVDFLWTCTTSMDLYQLVWTFMILYGIV